MGAPRRALLDRLADLRARSRTPARLLLLGGLAVIALGAWWDGRQDRTPASVRAETHDPAEGPGKDWPGQPLVSVLVAAWNEAANIERHVETFLRLGYPHKELVLCAGGTDGTYDLAARLAGPQVVVLRQEPGEGKQRALQRCLAEARGSLIMLSDADCAYTEEAFFRLLDPLARGEATVATGTSEPWPEQYGEPLVQYLWYTDLVRAQHMPPVVDGVLGRNCALRRETLAAIGGFSAPVRTGTDYHMSRLLERGGHTIRAVPHSRIPTEYPTRPGAYLRMWRRWNKNLLIHGARLGAWRDVRSILVALGLYALIPLLPLLAPVLGPVAWVLGALLFAKALANRLSRTITGARLAGRRVTWRNVVTLPLYTGLDAAALALAVRDALSPTLRGRW